jgi:hypothetical protein
MSIGMGVQDFGKCAKLFFSFSTQSFSSLLRLLIREMCRFTRHTHPKPETQRARTKKASERAMVKGHSHAIPAFGQ